MPKILTLKPRINKRTKAIDLALPKKKLPKKVLKKILAGSSLKVGFGF